MILPQHILSPIGIIAKNLDGLILMITFNQVSKEIPKKVIEQLNLSGIDILGVATNSLKHRPEDDETLL